MDNLVDEITSQLGHITVTRDIEDYEELAFDAATAESPQEVVNTFLWFYEFYEEVTVKISRYGGQDISEIYYGGYFIEDDVLKYVEGGTNKVHEMTSDDYKELIYELLHFTWENVEQFFYDEKGNLSQQKLDAHQNLICNLRKIERDFKLDYPWDYVYECKRGNLDSIPQDFDDIVRKLNDLIKI